ncbi:MAG: cupin domain-containing protein [Chloroflexia bacterium]|nr:cupin domain-containing protein [Chloroflexia bacterium]
MGTTRYGRAGDARVATMVSGADTGGRLAILELREVAGQEPPRHVHAHEDEIVYVQEGRLTFFIGETEHPATAGACLLLPRGIEHGYVVESGQARLLVTLTPAGMEGYFAEENDGRTCADLERLIAALARYGVTITGPPPTVEDCERRRTRRSTPPIQP